MRLGHQQGPGIGGPVQPVRVTKHAGDRAPVRLVLAVRLAERWSKVSAVLFAIGAVSGTVLSFEMGLLWPGLMGRFGDVLGVPFALEGLRVRLPGLGERKRGSMRGHDRRRQEHQSSASHESASFTLAEVYRAERRGVKWASDRDD